MDIFYVQDSGQGLNVFEIILIWEESLFQKKCPGNLIVKLFRENLTYLNLGLRLWDVHSPLVRMLNQNLLGYKSNEFLFHRFFRNFFFRPFQDLARRVMPYVCVLFVVSQAWLIEWWNLSSNFYWLFSYCSFWNHQSSRKQPT